MSSVDASRLSRSGVKNERERESEMGGRPSVAQAGKSHAAVNARARPAFIRPVLLKGAGRKDTCVLYGVAYVGRADRRKE